MNLDESSLCQENKQFFLLTKCSPPQILQFIFFSEVQTSETSSLCGLLGFGAPTGLKISAGDDEAAQ